MAPGAIDIPTPALTRNHSAASSWSSDPVAFGGDDQWIYLPDTKRFDLSRGSLSKLVIDADDGVRHHKGCMIDPEKTVLVIIDMQNYFIHPKIRDHAGGIAAVKPTLQVLEKCRKEGIQVVWLNWVIDDYDLRIMPPAVQRAFDRDLIATNGHGWHIGLGAELPDGMGRGLWKGSWNAELYEPMLAASRPEDLVFAKNRPSGMWRPDEPLHRYMRESKKKTMLFAGVNTDQCVLGTLTDSYSSGFDCILINDCAGTMTGFSAKEVCDYNVATNYGFLTDSNAMLASARI
ncbi:MAG: hypothetical protein M1828_001193 [Chrysothrix sp. TS-e1954]|nr:MAG: hypothetical protein M1828_001193 [Chrysothrix sp. TS-e1954]